MGSTLNLVNIFYLMTASLGCFFCTFAFGQDSREDLAKSAQNPLANMVSIPLQLNTNFSTGPNGKTQNVMNIQPVVPFRVNSEWNLITRTILPLVWQPELVPGQGSTFGLGDTQLSAILVPNASSNRWIWGVGIVTQLPTHTDDLLGNSRWGLGPTAVVLHTEVASPWVYGALINNVWSVSGSSTYPRINQLVFQPFANYNLPGGVYLTTSPLITSNWEAASGQKWTVPLGGGIGKIFQVGKLPVNDQIGAYYNVVRPDYAPSWTLRLQAQMLLPK